MLKVGGQALQDECKKNYPQGIGYGEVAVTSGYNLPCSYVCHGSLDQWRKDGSSIKVRFYVLKLIDTLHIYIYIFRS